MKLGNNKGYRNNRNLNNKENIDKSNYEDDGVKNEYEDEDRTKENQFEKQYRLLLKKPGIKYHEILKSTQIPQELLLQILIHENIQI
jgi:hypothetical protein